MTTGFNIVDIDTYFCIHICFLITHKTDLKIIRFLSSGCQIKENRYFKVLLWHPESFNSLNHKITLFHLSCFRGAEEIPASERVWGQKKRSYWSQNLLLPRRSCLWEEHGGLLEMHRGCGHHNAHNWLCCNQTHCFGSTSATGMWYERKILPKKVFGWKFQFLIYQCESNEL